MTKLEVAKRIAKLRGMPQTAGKNLMSLSRAQLDAALGQAEQAYVETGGRSSRRSRKPQGAQGPSAAAKKPRKSRSTRASRGTRGGPTKTMKARAAKIVRAIASGRIKAVRGLGKPADASGATPRKRYEQFLAAYKTARITRKSARGTRASKGIKSRYAALRGQKFPYYLVHGYKVPSYPVGGGRRGPGVIRPIPGSGAPGFMALTDAQKREVVAFLNGTGKVLRSKGTGKGEISVSAVVAAHMQTRQRASRASSGAVQRASRKTLQQAARAEGTANRWW